MKQQQFACLPPRLHVTGYLVSLSSAAILLTQTNVHAQESPLPQLPGVPSSPSPVFSEGQYVLDADDQVFVQIFNVPDYSREYRVLTDGTLSMPLVGAVSIRGLTLAEASQLLTERYSRFIQTPTISVELIAARPIQIAIAGEVNRPGVYTIPSGVDPSTVTITEAIQRAGGITQSANIREIEVHSSQSSEGSKKGFEQADLWALLTTGDITQDLQLQDGDTVYLPTVQSPVEPGEAQTLSSASFSPGEIVVNVVGEVNSPGAVLVPPNTPLNQVVLAAGGFNNDANEKSVKLIRLNQNGTVSQRTIEIDFAEGVNEASNPPLRANDTVVISSSGFANFSRTLRDLLSPVTGVFSLFRLLGL